MPLPELEDRKAIVRVHAQHKRLAEDVDLDVVARGTPGMSGADLANLVNEAALFAVRDGEDAIFMRHFEMARDRVLMGQRRDSMALSDEEKEAIAYHEAGHAVCAATLEHADPVHKVTILPTGMALGVTQQLPVEERHIHRQDYIEDTLVVRMGGRIAEELVFGVILDRRQQRPRGQHRAGPQDGPRVGHERARRADGLGQPGPGVPGRGPHAHPGLQRRHRPDHRRRGREDPAGPGSSAAARPSPATATASTWWPGRCSSTRPSTAPRSSASSASPPAGRPATVPRQRARDRPRGPARTSELTGAPPGKGLGAR